jgi:hypothetical protein
VAASVVRRCHRDVGGQSDRERYRLVVFRWVGCRRGAPSEQVVQRRQDAERRGAKQVEMSNYCLKRTALAGGVITKSKVAGGSAA